MLLVERRKWVRLDLPRERAKLDSVLANSRRLIAEIDVLLKHSREITARPPR